jgi:hypothetical protein
MWVSPELSFEEFGESFGKTLSFSGKSDQVHYMDQAYQEYLMHVSLVSLCLRARSPLPE